MDGRLAGGRRGKARRLARGGSAVLAAALGLLWAGGAGTARAADAAALGAALTVEPAVLMRLAAAPVRLPPAGRSGTGGGASVGGSAGEPAPAAGPAEAAVGAGQPWHASGQPRDTSGQPPHGSGAGAVLQLSEDLSAPAETAVERGVRATVREPAERGWLAVFAPRDRDLGLFLAAQASLFIDMAQTIEIRRTDGLYETNSVLGRRPRDEAVVAYFGSIAALHAVAYALLPGRWANVVSRGILFIELPAIDNNARVGIRVQF